VSIEKGYTMLSHLLKTIICDEFDKNVGRWQSRNKKQTAMLLSFSIHLPNAPHKHNTLQLALYGHCNYVQVWERSVVNVLSKNAEASDWKLLCDHDSCWRDTVGSWLFDNRDSFGAFTLGPWYNTIDWEYKRR
jgi:hypothetical protein